MSADFSRYSRQLVLREVGVAGQQVLRDSSVLVVGLGGLGSIASMYLAGAGVGRLLLSDRDRVDASNLHRQILYIQTDVGRAKTEAAVARLAALNPEVSLEPHEGRLTPERLAALVREADVVLDCTDNFPTRFAINEACVKGRKPLVSGAAIRYEGQLSVFDASRADGACYACVFPAEGESQEACEEAGVLGPVVGVIGSLQAHLALALLLGHGEELNQLRLWNARDLRWREVAIVRDPQCRICGKPP